MGSKFRIKHDIKTTYNLFHENVKLTKSLKRIIIKKNYFSKLINEKEIGRNNNYYFIHGEKGFNSFLFKKKFDLIFTNNDNEIIFLEEEFESNKVTAYYSDLKFIYLLPMNTIKKQNMKLGNILLHSRF